MKPLCTVHEALLLQYEWDLSHSKEQSTVRSYLAEIRHFLTWMEQEEKSLASLSQIDIILFRDEMVERGRKRSTINKWVSIINSFLKWSQEKGILQYNIAEGLRFAESHRDQPQWLTPEQELQLLLVASQERNAFKRARNEALIYIMLYAGLRVEEVSSLQVQGLQEGELVVFEEGKDAAKRKIPILPVMQVKLLEWLKHRSLSPKKVHQESVALFVTERSGFMQPRSIQFVMSGYGEKLGYTLTCQMLRHTFCRRLVEKGISLDQIMRWAGHKTIQSTIRYLDE
ncbi:tyrosine-type recombinase/integrase [Ammoniphilus sp. 3BR4]|uniref:tyrosine-type recombinase/integrase n=1 Tax=Ammoniphilus sp. 3BR4 TaxID=3158265 RepID=UPI0034675906